MASTPLSSLKTSTSTAPSTTSSAKSSGHSSSSSSAIQRESHTRGPSLDEDNDSGDEWGVEIGDLIIDLDADVEKDEMKEKNDARNSNNNNSIKSSNGGVNTTSSQASLLPSESVLNSPAKPDSGDSTKSGKTTASAIVGSLPISSGKAKSKTKKSSKPSAMNKQSGVSSQIAATPTSTAVGRNDPPSGNDFASTATSVGRTAKLESASSKTNRSYKKHGKNSNNSNDKKSDGGPTATKEGREKSAKSGKVSKHQSTTAPPSPAYSVAGGAFTSPSVMGSLPAASNKGKRVNSPCLPSTASNITSHRSSTPIDAMTDSSTLVTSISDKTALCDKMIPTLASEAPVLGAVSHLGKHRKTSSLPSPMKYQKPFGGHNIISTSPALSNAPSPLTATSVSNSETNTGQNITGKRERSSNAPMVPPGNKKMKLEKEAKFVSSGMTPNDGDNIVKPGTGSPGSFSGQVVQSLKNEYKMTIGQQKLPSSDAKEDKKTNSTRSAASSNTSAMQHPSKGGSKNGTNSSGIGTPPGSRAGIETPQNNVPTPNEQNCSDRRTVGTVTTYADVGVATEPESLGPCEPGTSVHLSGIVWHETESGVLVVNVTWRNRSYVGTLLDATKHDWAPPRIPDADSDTEYRVKSGRPKRHRGANVNGSDGGRKGRKSALANSLDDYKCSPSSNKRRSAKMSESDAYSGNDGEICTTPSKSAKRARLSRTAATKQAAQKTSNATAVKESSGDGTSGSGSSTCSSPIFMECPYANCKKRYKDDSALKYHESHAHQGEELAKNVREEESPAVDSPKDFDNASTKSVEEMPASDSSESPNAGEIDQAPKDSEKHFNMDTDSLETSAQAPFVVTQGQVTSSNQFTSAFPSPKQSSMQNDFTDDATNNEEPRTRNEHPAKHSVDAESSASNLLEPTSTGDVVSPYTLTDSQSNDSICLKTPMQMKPPPRNYGSSLSRTTESKEHAMAVAAALEASTAVDNESAQAVQTLLQLQENTQDQLPGLTQYGQTSQGSSMSMTTQLEAATTSTSGVGHSPSHPHSSHPSPVGQADKFVVGAQAKPQTPSHTLTPTFRGHSKDGTPLPRMSVGVCSPRNQAGGHYVGGYSHGTVTASSVQERSSHHTSSGLKTVKVKTVPIPTDPQQMLAPSSQPGGLQGQSSVNGAKKQKRKKAKVDSGKSPTEPSKQPGLVNQATVRPTAKEDAPKTGPPVVDHIKIKQEQQVHSTNHPPGHYRIPYDSQFHGAKPCSSAVKSEPVTKSSSVSQPPVQAYVHPTSQHPPRSAILHQDQNSREQHQVPHVNRNNNNKLNPHGGSTQTHQIKAASPLLTDKGDAIPSRDSRPRIAHVPPIPHGTSHSLPGSRSRTPVESYGQTRYRLNVPPTRDSATPTNSQIGPSQIQASSKESASPPPPPDERGHSSEGGGGAKKIPANSQRTGFPPHGVPPIFAPGMLSQYLISYDLGTYQAQFMNDPKFQQHYEKVIQQEIQKDQKAKEEFGEDRLQDTSLRQKSTPSPSDRKHIRSKSPSRTDERVVRELSPRDRPYPQPSQQIQPNNPRAHGPQQVHAPRASPVPAHASYLATPSKLSAGVPPPMARALSPRPQTTPPPGPGNRPSRPNSEAERYHRREPSTGERAQPASRNPVTPNRKPAGEVHPERRPSSPDMSKAGPSPTSAYASPVQLPPGARTPVPYYPGPYQHALIDPRVSPYSFPAYAMFPPGAHIFHGHWPPGAPVPTVPGAQEKAPSQSPHAAKPSHERPSSVSRSPYREESDRRQRSDTRAREVESYSSSKERRISEGPPQQSRKSVTPDPKGASSRIPPGDGNSGTVTPPMQRHLHTHHHIHEGFPLISPHAQYPYPMASAVMAGTEAAAAATLAQYPKRDLP